MGASRPYPPVPLSPHREGAVAPPGGHDRDWTRDLIVTVSDQDHAHTRRWHRAAPSGCSLLAVSGGGPARLPWWVAPARRSERQDGRARRFLHASLSLEPQCVSLQEPHFILPGAIAWLKMWSCPRQFLSREKTTAREPFGGLPPARCGAGSWDSGVPSLARPASRTTWPLPAPPPQPPPPSWGSLSMLLSPETGARHRLLQQGHSPGLAGPDLMCSRPPSPPRTFQPPRPQCPALSLGPLSHLCHHVLAGLPEQRRAWPFPPCPRGSRAFCRTFPPWRV